MTADLVARSLPLGPGDHGPTVRDLASRLAALGHVVETDGRYGPAISEAVRRFQQDHGLPVTGGCDHLTWSVLIEAGFQLGDRLIFLTSPMLRGDDVADLQFRLGSLGFDAGRVDGIFGPATHDAVEAFQHDTGLVPDAVVGRDTVDALGRLQPRGGTATVAGVRERVALRSLADRRARVAVCHLGGTRELAGAIATTLHATGVDVSIVETDDWSTSAAVVNRFEPDACLALLDPSGHPGTELAYFETARFSSNGGAALCRSIAAQWPTLANQAPPTISGMQLPILRETRAPTVAVSLDRRLRPDLHVDLTASAIVRGVDEWCLQRAAPVAP